MGNVKWFRGGLVFKVHRLLCHSNLASRVIKREREVVGFMVLIFIVSGFGFWDSPNGCGQRECVVEVEQLFQSSRLFPRAG